MNTRPSPPDTPVWVAAVLAAPATWLVARLALTLPYWWSGVDKALHPQAAQAEIAGLLGSASPLLPYFALLVTQLGGSLLVIFNRWTWLGAGALGMFTLLVTILAHAFWKLDGAARFAEMNLFMEHIAIVAGFMFAAILAHDRSPLTPSCH